jgi:hypothetical protein
VDGRRREARMAKSLRTELVAHLGGAPSVTQRALIERAVSLTMHIALMDKRMAEIADPVMGQSDTNRYLAWSNALERTMRRLGLEAKGERKKTLADYAAERAARQQGAAA